MSDGSRTEVEQGRGAGWIAFAAALLITGGVFKVFDAFWAFKYDDEIAEPVQTIVFENDLQSWGWVWLVLGILLILTGVAVVQGSEIGRWAGIVIAGIAAIVYTPWIYFQPLWTILSVTLAVLVIYALAAYGGHAGPAGRR